MRPRRARGSRSRRNSPKTNNWPRPLGDQLMPTLLSKEEVERRGNEIEDYRSALFKEMGPDEWFGIGMCSALRVKLGGFLSQPWAPPAVDAGVTAALWVLSPLSDCKSGSFRWP
jgi:hypothetical protein